MSSRKRLNFKEKAKILEEYSKQADKEKICKEFGIGKTCLYQILKDKDTILSMNDKKNSANAKKFAIMKGDDLENQLCLWIKSKNEKGMVLSGDDVKVKAKMLSENLGYEKRINFSNGWLQRFKRRNDLRCKKLIGEKQNADLEAAENFVTETLPDLLSKFKPDEVYNVKLA